MKIETASIRTEGKQCSPSHKSGYARPAGSEIVAGISDSQAGESDALLVAFRGNAIAGKSFRIGDGDSTPGQHLAKALPQWRHR